jgi:dihydrofolate reductase
MRKIVVSEFITLDGVFEDPGGAEHTSHGGWSMPFADADYQKYKYDELMAADDLLLGHSTYEGFAAAWPKMKGAGDFGEKMNTMPKHVVTSSLKHLAWTNSHVISGDVVEEIKKLKAQNGTDILVAGSGQLVRLLLDNQLVDKLCLMVHPVILGDGKQLFSGAKKASLHLNSSTPLKSGVVILEYTPAV